MVGCMRRNVNGRRVGISWAIAGAIVAIGAARFPAATLAAAPAVPEACRKAWNDAAPRIDAGIERNRKGDASIEVVDADGRPLSGASVRIRQTSHRFLFGCNAFVLGQMGDKNRKYEEAFLRLFNFATVPFYWEGTEPVRGELRYAEGARDVWRRPPTDRFTAFAAKHGLTLKGHPLLWHAYNPSWLPKDPAELKSLYQKRFREIASRYAGGIPIWDVVNESLVSPKTYPLWTPEREYVAWAFKEAEPLFPAKAELMINEVTEAHVAPLSDRYFKQVEGLLKQGLPVRGIGFQYHYFRREALDRALADPKRGPDKMLDVYERFAAFDRPMYVTEITIPSAGEGGEALQAEMVRNHYRLWFSAPKMAGITWWNLGDGTAVRGENEAKGGLMDDALEPKVAYRVLEQLIHREWKTNLAATTDASGKAAFRGFYGGYAVEVNVGGATREFRVDLAENAPNRFRLEWKPDGKPAAAAPEAKKASGDASGKPAGTTAGDPLDAARAALPEKYRKAWSEITPQLNANIERYRKGDAKLEVVDAAGRPAANASIEIRQKSHEFLFGCNLFVLGQLETPELNRKYEEAFARLFNSATVPFYWGDLEPQAGKPRFAEGSPHVWRRPPPDRLVRWCKEHGITPKGHVLMYVKKMFMPDWVNPADPEMLKTHSRRHMAEIAARYERDIPLWDAVNEELPRKANPREWHAVPDDYAGWCFDEAAKLFPGRGRLLINDGTDQAHITTDEYERLIQGLLKSGRRVEGIGMQFHTNHAAMFTVNRYAPKRMLEVYERFGRLGVPLYITEITVPGVGVDGSARQAAITADLYRLWFGTPSMAGVTWWNLGDGTAFQNENAALGGLLDRRMEPKPAYQALDRMINREWKTQLTATTDALGKAAFRGFYGKYEVRITAGGKTQTVELNWLKNGPGSHRIALQ